MNLERVFLTHQCVCKEIIKADGKNDFKIPHMGKLAIIRRQGHLPMRLRVEEEVLQKIRELRPDIEAEIAAQEPPQQPPMVSV